MEVNGELFVPVSGYERKLEEKNDIIVQLEEKLGKAEKKLDELGYFDEAL